MIQRTIAVGMFWGVLFGLLIDTWYMHGSKPIVYAREPEPPKEVLLQVKIDWNDKERIKEEIRKVFPEQPELLIRVAQCESGLIPHAHNSSTNDGGIFQISEPYHGHRLKELGLDPFKVEDNLKYARLLYDESGLQPWSASKHCWSK